MTRRERPLSEEERALWYTVARSADPLRPGEALSPPARVATEPPEPKPEPRSHRAASSPAPKPMPQGPTAIDRKTRTRLSRGTLDVDGRLDLHGLTQGPAHQRLRRFLEEGQARGAKLVLIITGKGSPEAFGEERGVLRRAVPAWLESTEFRHIVSGFDEAGRRHGGAGAIYVRIRRRREA